MLSRGGAWPGAGTRWWCWSQGRGGGVGARGGVVVLVVSRKVHRGVGGGEARQGIDCWFRTMRYGSEK